MSDTETVVLELTKDERAVLHYVVGGAAADDSDPLKDIYELGDDEPADPYAALRSMAAKLSRARTKKLPDRKEWSAVEPPPVSSEYVEGWNDALDAVRRLAGGDQ